MNVNARFGYLITLILLISSINLFSFGQESTKETYQCQHSKQLLLNSTPNNVMASSSDLDTRSDTIDITNYTINLNITDFAGQTISGNCEVSFKVLEDGVSQLSLDLVALNIDSVTSGNDLLTYSYNDTLVRLALPATLNKGDSAKVVVYYNGSPIIDPSGWGGFYWNAGYAFNLGVGFGSVPHNYGRVWFPCFDNFMERSTYTFNIITSGGKNAKCNGTYLGSTPLAGDTIINHWRLYETMPTYLACVAVAEYETVNIPFTGLGGPVPIELYAKSNDTAQARASFANIPAAMTAYENGYGAYQWNKVGYSMVPFNAGAMEHATNIAYPNYAADGTLGNEELMAHELAHMWWGDLVTCEKAADMWLNEGMASYSEFLFNEYVYGVEEYRQHVIDNHESVIHLAHIQDGGRYALDAIPLDVTYGEQVYNKGADVAHTLRGYMGDSLFFGGLTSFLAAHQFSHMNSYMLRDHLTQYSGIDLSDFFDKWVFHVGWPHFSIDSLTVSPNGPNFDAMVYVKQKLLETDFYASEVPLEITFFDADWSEYTETIMASGLLSSQSFNIPFNPVYAAINYYNKISDAISSDVKTISAPGLYNFVANAGGHLSFTVNSITDSALIRVEHNWVHPDPIVGPNKYKLCPNRYWKIDGIMPSNYSMSAKVFYDGRESGGSYYDHDLFSTPADHEDSLVVLYRTGADGTWSEWPYVTQTVIAANDEWGQIVFDSIILGEYVFALKGTLFSSSTNITAVSHVSCNGACDGSATISADGGVGPYTYLWDDPAAQQTNIATGLCSGDYSVIVSDAAGDTVTLAITISELDALGGYTSTTLETCTGCGDGTISFIATGGATPYTYQWNDPDNQTTITATGLSEASMYGIIVNDANGCSYSATGLTVGKEEIVIEEIGITLSPNPTSGSFEVASISKAFDENIEILVSDINGKTILRKSIPKGAHKIEVPTKNWKSGIYLVTIQNIDGLLYSDKIIYTRD